MTLMKMGIKHHGLVQHIFMNLELSFALMNHSKIVKKEGFLLPTIIALSVLAMILAQLPQF